MSAKTKILSDAELSLLRTRFMANPETLIDPAVARQLLDTAEFYRDGVQLSEKYLPSFVRAQVII